MCSDGDDVTCAGSLFQTRAAEPGKARSPKAQRRVTVCGTTSASDDDERRRCLDSRSATVRHSRSVTYEASVKVSLTRPLTY